MRYESLDQLESSCKQYAECVRSGKRQRRNYADELVLDELKKKASKRCSSSRFFVYQRSYNFGTKKFPDINPYHYDVVEIKGCKECPKSFVRDFFGKQIFRKDNIVAWLS